MERLIDADKVLEAIRERKKEKTPNYWNEDMYIEGLNTAEHEVKYATTIEAEPVKHGRCISDIYGMKCSECDRDLYENSINFCPNCGAKMDGE